MNRGRCDKKKKLTQDAKKEVTPVAGILQSGREWGGKIRVDQNVGGGKRKRMPEDKGGDLSMPRRQSTLNNRRYSHVYPL